MPPPLPDQEDLVYGHDNDMFSNDGIAANGDGHEEPLGTIVHLADEDDDRVGYNAMEPVGPINYLASESPGDLDLDNHESVAPTTARKRGRPSVSRPFSRMGTPAETPIKSVGRPPKTPRIDKSLEVTRTPALAGSVRKRKADAATDGAPPVKKTRVGKPLKAERAPERVQSRRGAAEAAKATFSTALKKAKIVESSDPAPKKRGREAKANSAANAVSSEAYEVEEIIDSNVDANTKQLMYLVKWKGYSSAENTWEPKKNLSGASQLIKKFNATSKGEEPAAKNPRGRKPKAPATSNKTPGRKIGASKPGRKPATVKAASTTAAEVAVPKRAGRKPRAAHGK